MLSEQATHGKIMRFKPPVFGIFAATIIASATLHGQTADLHACLDEIRELLKPAESDSPDVKNLKTTFYGYPDQWQRLLDRDDLNRFADYGQHDLGRGLAAIPGLADKIQEFTRSVAAEVERRDAARIAEAEALVSKAAETLIASKKAEDLDAIMISMSKLRLNENGSNPKVQAKARDIANALQIAASWQEYLIADEAGNIQERRNHLERISSLLASNPIVPRSFVLRLINPESTKTAGDSAKESAAARLSLDDIKSQLIETGDSAAALAAVKSIPEGMLKSQDLSFVSTLSEIEELRRVEPTMAESEVLSNIRTISNTHNQGAMTFVRAIDQIALNAIGRSYGLEPSSTTTNSARKVIDAIATDAANRKDWPKLRKAIQSIQSLGSRLYGNDYDHHKLNNDLRILSMIELGESAEKRGDLETAVTVYMEAYGLDGYYLRYEQGYSKIADLQAKHPAEVEDLMARSAEKRMRKEAARHAAEIEARARIDRFQAAPVPPGRLQQDDIKAMKPLIQEVVAEFLMEKRGEAPNTKENPKKAK